MVDSEQDKAFIENERNTLQNSLQVLSDRNHALYTELSDRNDIISKLKSDYSAKIHSYEQALQSHKNKGNE